jgi:hypothetical protein
MLKAIFAAVLLAAIAIGFLLPMPHKTQPPRHDSRLAAVDVSGG